jgi:hypothetical protein
MSKFVKQTLFAVAVIAAAAAVSMMSPRQLLAQIRAALVRDVDHPARQPVHLRGIDTFDSTGAAAGPLEICFGQPSCTTVVPAGKRLVIEFLSVYATIPSGDTVDQLTVSTRLLPATATTQYLTVTFQSTHIGQSRFRGAHMVRMYADPGTSVNFQSNRSSATAGGNIVIHGSGYLVDLN